MKKWTPIFCVLFLLLFWKLGSLCCFTPVMLPPPEAVFISFLRELKRGTILIHVGVSFYRVMLAFLISSASGVMLGLLMGWVAPVRRAIEPLVEIFRPIPPIAWIPLAILWFGIGESSKIFVITYGMIFPITLNTIHGVRSIDENLIKLARSMGLKRLNLLKEVILPGALPSILTGMRIGLGVGWMCLIASELIAASSGIGFMIEESKMLLLTDRVIMGMLLIGALSLITNGIMQKIERRLISWV